MTGECKFFPYIMNTYITGRYVKLSFLISLINNVNDRLMTMIIVLIKQWSWNAVNRCYSMFLESSDANVPTEYVK